MLSVVIQALKKFLCTPFASRPLIYSYWAFEITPCIAHQPDGIHPVQTTSFPGRFSLDLEVGREKALASAGQYVILIG